MVVVDFLLAAEGAVGVVTIYDMTRLFNKFSERKKRQDLRNNMPLPEVIPALDRGTIDATHSAMSVFVNFKFNDIAKTVTETDDTLLVPVGVLSKAWLSKLPQDLAQMVVEEGRKLQSRVQGISFKYEEDMQNRWRAAGGEVVRLPTADQAKLVQLLKPIGTEVTKSDPALSTFYKRVSDVAARN